ncbi:MAG: MarR family transcriptional regulator [Methanomassiliicoccales archaeon]
MTVSRRESQVIDEIERRDMTVFSPTDVRRFLDLSPGNAYRILNNMEEKGLVKRIERGKYVLREKWEEMDLLEIVSELFTPSYIGFWSALHFHGMTDQVPRKVFVTTTKRKRSMELQGQEVYFVTVKRSMFFGYERYGRIVVSDREKTIVDCLRHPEYGGGIRQVAEAIDDSLDESTLVDYAERMGSPTVASRLGYLLDTEGMRTSGLERLVGGYTKLDPDMDMSNPVSKWKIYANRGI